MELAQLRYLVTIADEGGFTQAARKLRLSQPSLSLAIKKLEDEVGQPLFDRLTRRVVPTEAGERMIETARRTLADLDRTACEVRDLKGEVTGTLRVGAIPTIGPFVLPEILERFYHQFPDVIVHVTEGVTDRLLQLLEQGQLDVALVSIIPERPGIHADLIGHEELVAALPPKSPLAAQATLKWADIEQQRFLVLGEEHCLAEQIAWFCRKNRLSGRTIMEGTQLATIIALIHRGMGVSLVPAMMQTSPNSQCEFRPLTDPVPSRPIYLAWSLLRYRTQAGRQFATLSQTVVQAKLDDPQLSQSVYPDKLSES